MPAWPDKWDGEETFEAALQAWEASAQPAAEVATEVKRWIGTRQDNPHDADRVQEEGLFGDVHTVRAWVRDLYLRPIETATGYVVCLYEIHEVDHCLNCLYFTTRGTAPPG